MARMQFGITAFERARGDLPELPVVNMIAEDAPTEETGVVLQSRPGLIDRSATMGVGPVKALFRADGVMSGALFGVSGTRFYQETTELGAIDGAGPFFIEGYQNRMFIAGGGSLWTWEGSTFAAVPFPDEASVTKAIVAGSRLVCIRADTGQFYWTDPLGNVIDGLAFATAENQPDPLKDMLFVNDGLILFGSETVEFWSNTGNSNLPFQPLEGQVFEAGIRATGCAVEMGGSFAWVTDNHRVCLSDPNNVLSNAGLEARIQASTSVALWTLWLEGTEFLALRLDDATWIYSTRSGRWSQFASHGADNWLARCGADGVFGCGADGRTLKWGPGHIDLGGVLERRFRAGFPLVAGTLQINNLLVRTNPGDTPYLSGDYIEPVMEMRRSPNAGRTWGNWRPASMGMLGQYRTKVQWTALGMASQPGMLAEFRVTAPVDVRISDVRFNESFTAI